jgi:ubiquinone/menaquinone biosynthesis C-methylase UbiE
MDDGYKRIIRDTFDAVANGYDSAALRFFVASAEHMAERLGLRGDEEVLDVACGTGNASVALARRLPRGHVTAVDFSPAMLERARAKASVAKLANIDFVEGDMQALPWQGRFDVAVCAFGIFFVADMDAALAHIARTVKPNGRIMITSFARGYMEPMRSLLMARAQKLGVEPPPQVWLRIADAEGCRGFFAGAGLVDVDVDVKDVGYTLASPEDWWDIVWNAGFRRVVTRIPPADQPAFKAQHLAEVEALRTPDGIPLPIPVLFSSGKPVRG